MILWIDPWIRKLGYALTDNDLIIKDAGILLLDDKAPTREYQYARMKQIYQFFVEMVEEHDITAVGVEKLFFTRFNQSNAEFVYGIRGALLMLFVEHDIQIFEWTPKELKKRVTGNGLAWKELVQSMVQRHFHLAQLPEPHDAADALGLCWMVKKVMK